MTVALEAGFTQEAEETPEWCYLSSVLYRICTRGPHVPGMLYFQGAGIAHPSSQSSVVQRVVLPTGSRLEHGGLILAAVHHLELC